MVTLKAPPPRVTRSPLSIPIWASPAGTPLPISHLLSSAGYPPPQIPLGWRPPNPPLRRSGPVQPPFLLGRAARVKALRFAEGALRAQRWSLFLKARCTVKCRFILATNNRTPAQPARAGGGGDGTDGDGGSSGEGIFRRRDFSQGLARCAGLFHLQRFELRLIRFWRSVCERCEGVVRRDSFFGEGILLGRCTFCYCNSISGDNLIFRSA